ncbi:cell division protein ZapA [Curvibacter delicatus]|jgi:cell division protein ZapA|uniref:cell division protein ZapA n=1 Tax=Curvibacter delicatus TaxID=80879 RepID=UPI00082D3602|nr:cell division protein ZapA [Curvibacter delicatus]
MKQLEVQIMGQSYLLGCPEGGEARLLDAVERVDSAMCKIRDSGKVKARDRIAVLASLNLAFDLSERASAPVAAAPATTTSAAPAPAPTATAATHTAAHPDDAIAALLQRLDAVLGEDGRLI